MKTRPFVSKVPDTQTKEYELTFPVGATRAEYRPHRPFRALNIWCGKRNAEGQLVLDLGPSTEAIRSIVVANEEQLVDADEPGFGLPVDSFGSPRPVMIRLPVQQPGQRFVVELTAPATRKLTLTIVGRELVGPEGT